MEHQASLWSLVSELLFCSGRIICVVLIKALLNADMTRVQMPECLGQKRII